MSLETRSSSALFKRAEQLKRWEQSETNKEPVQPRQIARKIKFSADCVFLAACAAGDKEEVLRLLKNGADINTGNVDGLTALHQACIDDDLDMVEFLVEQGADINRGDNEGWTPLHATASCGFISIAKYLIEQGCSLAAVNYDGELALDIAESDEMEELLQEHINKAGIDCNQARSEEERSMMNDAKLWRSGGPGKDAVHPRSGATALHVAAAKGYIKVMNVLLQARCNVNVQDYDGWTPLHGAAHWGQLEACKLLVENFCDMDIKNFVGQTAFDVADIEILKSLEELKKNQQITLKENPHLNNQKQQILPKKRVSPTNDYTAIKNEVLSNSKEETPNKVIKVELEIQSDRDETSANTNSDVEKKNRANKDDRELHNSTENNKISNSIQNSSKKPESENTEEETIPSWRRSGSFKNKIQDIEATNSIPLKTEDKEKQSPKSPVIPNKVNAEPEVVLRRTHSFETDEKFYEQYLALRARIKASSCPTLHRYHPTTPTYTNVTTARSASLRETQRRKEGKINLELSQVPQESSLNSISNKFSSSPTLPISITCTTPSKSILVATTPSTTTTTTTTQVGITTPATITTPTTNQLPGNQIRRSFVPPVRDEESETQRKAHAKRVRETRRSTQGVTLDEIKSAEQLVKKKQQQNNELSSTNTPTSQSANCVGQTASIIATITTATPTTVATNKLPEETNFPERRPSWRLRVDNGSKFQLEDANNKSSDTTTAYIRRPSSGINVPRPSSAPIETIAANTTDATITLPLRRSLRSTEDKEQDKENDSRNAQATQAVIQRRRRPKRRSTGVVHVDMDEIDPEKQETGDFEDSKNNCYNESGNERTGRSNRVGSISSISPDTVTNSTATTTTTTTTPSRTSSFNSENGEINYKKLWEESQAENERLKDKLRRTDELLKESKCLLEKAQSAQNKINLSETEKRERRAMERKLSEMEEELKMLEQLKCENQRLKDENGALIRVISKLSK